MLENPQEAVPVPSVQEPFASLLGARLQQIVQAALGEPDAALDAWDAAPLKGRLDALSAARSVFLFRGAARVGAAERPWSVVLKVLAAVPGQDDPALTDYWYRERLLYDSGVLNALPAGLQAPRCYGCDEVDRGVAWLWLEYVHDDRVRPWTPEHWALVARKLGQFNGAYLAGSPLPQAPSLGGLRLHTWLDRHRPLVAQIAAAPQNPAVRRWWPQPVVAAILQLWEERDIFCAALERLPQTFCHGDAIPRNLLTRREADGSTELVAIDWEYAGYYAVGEEIGQTLSVAAAFFDVEPADLPAFDEALFASYLHGLHDAGWHGGSHQVRFAYAAHAALRNAFNAVGARIPSDAGRAAALQTYGRTWEELAERRAVLRPFLLDRATEARWLLDTL